LISWAKQGVLLLNAVLTVEKSSPNSHQDKGWEQFTTAAIKAINEKLSGVVFLLWGNNAKQKASLINASKHHVLQAAHPSPHSADKGFFGKHHFSQCNNLLIKQSKSPIDWKLPPVAAAVVATNPSSPKK